MFNPLIQVQTQAAQDSETLKQLFSQIGSKQYPNTPILTAYRNAKRSLRQVMRGPESERLTGAKDVAREIGIVVKQAVTKSFKESSWAGYGSAAYQLGRYGKKKPVYESQTYQINAALNVVSAKLAAQEAALQALILSGSDEALILGDDERHGVLRPADIIVTSVFWIASLFWHSWGVTTSSYPEFSKQVVAALDMRTTETCLRAHGQIQPLSGKFRLEGTPRFADELEWTPFHHYCRSSVVLYLPGYDDGLTDRMKESAQIVLDEREAGKWIDRHPADAFA